MINKEKLKDACWIYCDFIKKTTEVFGKDWYYGIEQKRIELHYDILFCFGEQLERAETLDYCYNLDKINYNGDKLAEQLLSVYQKLQERRIDS